MDVLAKKILKKKPERVSGPSVLARLAVLELADVVDDGLAEAVDVHPRAVAYAVACRSYVDHVALAARGGDAVVHFTHSTCGYVTIAGTTYQ